MEAIQTLLNNLAVSFDLPILDWIQANLQSGILDKIMPIITVLGDAGIFWIAIAVVLLFFPGTRKMMNRLTVLAALTPSCFVYSKNGSAGVLPRIECHTRTHGVIFLFRPRPVHRCRGRLSVFLFFSFLFKSKDSVGNALCQSLVRA